MSLTSLNVQRQRRINPYRLFSGAMIPNWLLVRVEVSQGAKLCYARLAQFAGQNGLCFPRQSTLAGELGIRERMVRVYLGELVKLRLVEVEQHGRGTASSYHFLDHEWIHEGQPYTAVSSPSARQDLAPLPGNILPGCTLNKRIMKRIMKSTPPPHEVGGLPRNEIEARETAKRLGIPEEFARDEFLSKSAEGWKSGYGNPITSWEHHLQARWCIEKRKQTERAAHPRGAAQTLHPATQGKQLEEMRRRIKEIEADADSYPHRTAEARAELCVLRKRERALSDVFIRAGAPGKSGAGKGKNGD